MAQIKYHDRFCDVARNLIARGMMLDEIAEVLGCHRGTVSRWQGKYPEFARAVAEGFDMLDIDAVERAHFKRAVGYDLPVEEIEEVTSPDGSVITERRVKRTVNHVPGNVAAQKNILFNLRRNKYAQKVIEENNIVPDINFIFHTPEKKTTNDQKAKKEDGSIK